jgi:hypothetical protein
MSTLASQAGYGWTTAPDWNRRLLERRGLAPGDVDACQADPVVEESPALAGISSASIQGRIALGSRAGAQKRDYSQTTATLKATIRGVRNGEVL